MPGKRTLLDPSRNGRLFAPEPRGPDGTAYEADALSRGFRRIAGVDEAGRGPLAGPVVAAAVVFEPGVFHPDIRDSKLLSPKKRERLVDWIEERAASWAVGVADSREIDRLNVLRASLLAMARAVRGLRVTPDYLMIDGPYGIPAASLLENGGPWSAPPAQRAVKGGDRVCFSIAAASIIAKVARDRMMVELDALYPEYGFASHKGYRSRRHAAALDRFGPCPVHRRSFRPVRECREQQRMSRSAQPVTEGQPATVFAASAAAAGLPPLLFGARNRDG